MIKQILMSSAAAIAVLAAAAPANAADIPMPVMAPVVAPAPVAVPGPVFTIEIDGGFEVDSDGEWDISANSEIGMRLASGWGFSILLSGGLEFFPAPPNEGVTVVGARVYRAVGQGTIGALVTRQWNWDLGVPGADVLIAAGVDAEWDTEALELDANVLFAFGGGNYLGVQSTVDAEINRGRLRVEVDSQFILPNGGPLLGTYFGTAGYRFGFVRPYATFAFGLFPAFDWATALGVELEHELAGGRLTLTGGGEVWIDAGGFNGYQLFTGFEVDVRGDDRMTLDGDFTYFGGGGWEAGMGFKVKFGG